MPRVKRCRSSSPEDLEPSQKVHRPSQDSSAEEDEIDENGWSKKAGMILEVHLKNFMCHQEFRYRPNQCLNFLCGDNGSGKSAVLTAVVFALGGSARMANRGSSNKGFIRTGQSQATVEVKLYNKGENSYRPDIYGDVIHIVRTVTAAGGSSYRLKSANGRIVTSTKVREELDRILSVFCIQVDNPIAILNQDTAKTFLFSCSETKLYEFFMRATQLDSCKRDYESVAEDKNTAERMHQEKVESFGELRKELEKWEKKHQFHKLLNTKRATIKDLKRELAWSLVKKAEDELEKTEKDLAHHKSKVEKCDKEADAAVQKQKRLKMEKRETEDQIQKIAKEIGLKEAEINKCKRDWAMKREAVKTVNREVAEQERKKASEVRNKENIEKTLEELRNTDASEYEARHNERQEKISQLESNRDVQSAQMQSTVNHIEHLRYNLNESKQKKYELSSNLSKVKGQLDTRKAELQNVQNQKDNKLIMFGEDVPKFAQLIQKNIGKFKKPPLGPLGAYVKFQPTVTKDVGALVESELSQILRAFVCDNMADQKVLMSLAKQCHRKPYSFIITTKFLGRMHDVSRGRVMSREYNSILDLLDIENPDVANVLIDQKSIEKILVIPKDQEAQQLLKSRATVPQNCRYAITLGLNQYFPAPNYRSYTMNNVVRQTKLIMASVDELVAGLKQDIIQLEGNVQEAQRAIVDYNREFKQHERELANQESVVNELKNKITGFNRQIVALKEEDENDTPPDIAALEEDLEKIEEKVAEIEGRLRELQSKAEELKEVAGEAGRLFKEKQAAYENESDPNGPLAEKLSLIEADIQKSAQAKIHYTEKKMKSQALVDEFEKEGEEKKSLVRSTTDKAREWSEERVLTRKAPEKIHKEICAIEDLVKRQQENEEPFDIVLKKVTELTASHGEIRTTLKQVKANIENLTYTLNLRKKGFKHIRNSISRRLQSAFTTRLTIQKFIGELRIDHKEGHLKIVVSPDGGAANAMRDLKSLSGGEKSYSTISLVLSLWDVISPPFRILDEFDVFMDAVRRRVSLDQIILYARDKKNFQYVFLTPLNTDNVDVGSDLSIVKLQKNSG